MNPVPPDAETLAALQRALREQCRAAGIAVVAYSPLTKGRRLDHPVVAAIAARLGVRLIGRHTALGDALLTGEIFLKLVPLLAERGVVTLRQALQTSRETYYARLQY